MKLVQVSVLVCALGVSACKTSQFRGKAIEAEAEDPDTTKAPTKAPPKTETPVVPVDSTVIDTSTTELQLKQSCEKPVQLLTTQVKLSFPESKKCDFNVEPNGDLKEGHLQAHKVSSASMKLPEASEICSMTIESPANTQLQYDDFIILTIDDFIVFTSNKDLLIKLAQVNGLYKWDFMKARFESVPFDTPPYCIGAMERCVLPVTDVPGPVLFKLNYSEISGITKAIQGKAQVPVNLVTTGDNDVDCFHTPLDLTITLNYIKKPK